MSNFDRCVGGVIYDRQTSSKYDDREDHKGCIRCMFVYINMCIYAHKCYCNDMFQILNVIIFMIIKNINNVIFYFVITTVF